MDDTQAFKQWLETIHKFIQSQSSNKSHTYLYGIDINSSDIQTLFGGKSDIYDLIEAGSTKAYFQIYDVLAFVTFGWAAPSNNLNTPPSEHPNRKRVMLTNYMSNSSKYVISALDFSGETETVWEYDNATQGTLKEALYGLY
jgi:hypothetical protein